MKKNLILIGLSALLLTLSMTGCNSTSSNSSTETTTISESAENTTAADPAEQFKVTELPQLNGVKTGDTIATIKTNYGNIKVWFFPEYAPKAVENFTTHATEGYYDNVIFHRVINDFMIQGGDPQGTGIGGESIWGADFENEVTPNLRSFRGALCMANAGPDTNGSQFYIVQSKDAKTALDSFKSQVDEDLFNTVYPANVVEAYEKNGGFPSLDFGFGLLQGSTNYGYTIFGQVYEGMDVVDKIAAVETNDSDKPLEDVVIEGIEVGTY